MGPFYGIWLPAASTEAMVHAMDLAGVRLLCFSHHYALFSPDVGNAATIEAVRKFPDRLRGYVLINPNYPDLIAKDLASYDSHGDVFVGLKILASYHGATWDDSAYVPALEFANERELMVLGHTWSGDKKMVQETVKRYPKLKLMLAHCIHDQWDAAIEVARQFPNVYLELCAVLDDRGAVEKFVDAGLADRILFGTDLPWFAPHQGIGALLSAEITDEDRHKVLHLNAERLLASVGVELG